MMRPDRSFNESLLAYRKSFRAAASDRKSLEYQARRERSSAFFDVITRPSIRRLSPIGQQIISNIWTSNLTQFKALLERMVLVGIHHASDKNLMLYILAAALVTFDTGRMTFGQFRDSLKTISVEGPKLKPGFIALDESPSFWRALNYMLNCGVYRVYDPVSIFGFCDSYLTFEPHLLAAVGRAIERIDSFSWPTPLNQYAAQYKGTLKHGLNLDFKLIASEIVTVGVTDKLSDKRISAAND